jgi:DNA repair exonuclease SbcCD ATPase subunit
MNPPAQQPIDDRFDCARILKNVAPTAIMTDRNIEQINHNLDQVLAISAENTRNITNLEATIERTNAAVQATNQAIQEFSQSAKPRLLSLETSREQTEEDLDNLEITATRQERLNLEQQARLDRMDEIIARYDRMHLDHQEKMEQSNQQHIEHQERLGQMRIEHQERLARQDRLIELLSRQFNNGTETA